MPIDEGFNKAPGYEYFCKRTQQPVLRRQVECTAANGNLAGNGTLLLPYSVPHPPTTGTGGFIQMFHGLHPTMPMFYSTMFHANQLQHANLPRPLQKSSAQATAVRETKTNADHFGGPRGGNGKQPPIRAITKCKNKASAKPPVAQEGTLPKAGVLSREKYKEFMEFSLQCCDLAEKIAIDHSKRPCFKKIDSLCARVKQDLTKPDNVVANIHSQGIAWSAKDFIFAFTRLINAWTVLRGYVHGTQPEMASIQNELDPKLAQSFARWQDATIALNKSLFRSLISLDKLEYRQRTGKVLKTSSPMAMPFGAKQGGKRTLQLCDFLQEPSLPSSGDEASCDSDENDLTPKDSQVSPYPLLPLDVTNDGSYIRTGVYYAPLATALSENCNTPSQPTDTRALVDVDLTTGQENSDQTQAYLAQENVLSLMRAWVNDGSCNEAFMKHHYNDESVSKITLLMQKVCEIEEAKYFFRIHFTKLCFPDIELAIPGFTDISTIFCNVHLGYYKNFQEVIGEFQKTIEACKNYLKQQNSCENHGQTVHQFVLKLGALLDNKTLFEGFME